MLTSHQSDSSLLILCIFGLVTCFSAWLITKLREGNVFTPICDSVHGGDAWQGGMCGGGSMHGRGHG